MLAKRGFDIPTPVQPLWLGAAEPAARLIQSENDDDGWCPRELTQQISSLLKDHGRWAKWNLRCYQWLIYLSVLSSLAAGVAALTTDYRVVVAIAAFLPIVLAAVQQHVDFKRRLRWDNEYIRELDSLAVRVRAADADTDLLNQELKELRARLDSAEYDPDSPPQKTLPAARAP